MNGKTSLLAVAFLCAGRLVLTGQESTAPAIITAAQAEAGHVAYDNSCGRCHTYTLRGRRGDEDELPPITSLSAADQKFIGTPNHVPPLAGKAFLDRWGDKTAAQLIARFEITAIDPSFHFDGINDEVVVNITAYVLQMNGAQTGSQPLTRATKALVNSVVQ